MQGLHPGKAEKNQRFVKFIVVTQCTRDVDATWFYLSGSVKKIDMELDNCSQISCILVGWWK